MDYAHISLVKALGPEQILSLVQATVTCLTSNHASSLFHSVSKSCGISGDDVAPLFTSLSSLMTEAAQHDYSLDDLLGVLDTNCVEVSNLESAISSKYTELKQDLRNHLSLCTMNPVLKDVNWRLDCSLEGSTGSDPLEYLLHLETSEGPVSFSARTCELADLVERLRAALIRVETQNF
ncbi:hypothetical protein P9112_012163 [Eukaryota sp. TZLM1-RC]